MTERPAIVPDSRSLHVSRSRERQLFGTIRTCVESV